MKPTGISALVTGGASGLGAETARALPAAREFAQFGIRVMTIAPGLFQTPLLAGLPIETQPSLANSISFPKWLGQASEFAALVLHILENQFLNGETIRLDDALRMVPR